MVSFALFLISFCTYFGTKTHNKNDHSTHIVQRLNNLKLCFVASSVFCGTMAMVMALFFVVLYISAI